MIYLIGSLRNPQVPQLANYLRNQGFEVYDDWFSDGKEADEEWYRYEQLRGRRFIEAINGWHARQVFQFDKTHIELAKSVVLMMPAGKSAHLELGWAIGQGKKGYVLFDKEPERFDIMYRFADGIFDTREGLLYQLKLDERIK